MKDIPFSKIDLLCYYIFLFCVWYVVESFSVKRIKQSLGLIIICQLIFLLTVYKEKNASELLIYNSYAQNIITIRNNKELTVLGKDSLTFKDSVLLKANQLKNNIIEFKCDKNEVFSFKKERYLVVDKNKLYDLLTQKGMNLIINNNPKINMERLMVKLQPKQVIITGFNYKSNQLKWKSTCKKLQVPFYCVTALGAYKKN